MPFPAGRRAARVGRSRSRAVLAAAAAAQLVVVPAGAVVSEYVGAGTPAIVTAGLGGLACAVAARAAAGRSAGSDPLALPAGPVLPLLCAVYAGLVVALAFRLVPGGVDPAPRDPATVGMYAVAVGAAVVTGWRR